MKTKDKILSFLIGGTLIILGLILIISLTGALDASKIFGIITPLTLIIGGLASLNSTQNFRTKFGIGIVLIGLISLLVAINIVRINTVSIFAGTIFLIIGSIVLYDTYKQLSSSGSTTTEKED